MDIGKPLYPRALDYRLNSEVENACCRVNSISPDLAREMMQYQQSDTEAHYGDRNNRERYIDPPRPHGILQC